MPTIDFQCTLCIVLPPHFPICGFCQCFPSAVLLFKGFEPLIGAASIQYANDEDWDQRQKCLYKTLKGEELKAYYPKFVSIAQVRKVPLSAKLEH